MHLSHIVSTLVLVIIFVGLLKRHQPRLHARWMRSAFLLDLALVLYVEISLGAVEQAIKPQLSQILLIHIVFSVASLVGWLALLIVGGLLLKGRKELRQPHVLLARLFLVARLGNYVTSFMLG